MRRFAFGALLAFVGACGGSPRAANPAAATATSTGSPLPPERTTEEWIALGMPSLDVAWTDAEWTRAAEVLERGTSGALYNLPRVGSPRSGKLYGKLVDVSSIGVVGERGVGALVNLCAASQRIAMLYAETTGYHEEWLGSVALDFGAFRAVWDASDEVPALREIGPGESRSTTDVLRRKSAELVSGLVPTLDKAPSHVPLEPFARRIAPDFAMIVRRLPPAGARAISASLHTAASRADSAHAAAARLLEEALSSMPRADLVLGEGDVRASEGDAIATLEPDRSHGFEVRFKRSGPHDLLIVPLAEKLAALKRTAPHRPLVVDAVPTTTYRALIEVLFTAGQNEWSTFDVRLKGDVLRHVVTHAPRVTGGRLATDDLNLTILVVKDGLGLKARGGNVAPGCDDVGPGLSIPNGPSGIDLSSLDACLPKLKQIAPRAITVTIAANPDRSLADVLAVIDHARGESFDLFPGVLFGLAR